MKGPFVPVLGIVLPLLLAAGCASEVEVEPVDKSERSEYNRVITGRDELLPQTVNTLGNYLLQEKLADDPNAVIDDLEMLFRSERDRAFLVTLADVALHQGWKIAESEPDRAAGWFLASLYYSFCHFTGIGQSKDQFNIDRVSMVRCYNLALGELYAYLKERNLHGKNSFELTMPTGRRINFEAPDYRLPLPEELMSDYLLCSDYRPKNLTHDTRRFGIGAPLIGVVRESRPEDSERFVSGQTVPLTLTLEFLVDGNSFDAPLIGARMHYIGSRDCDEISFNGTVLPLAWDFSTPLAYMVRDPLPVSSLFYTARPDDTAEYQGLYRFEPGDERRIPVVFVHGLMSDARTWLQMINTLYNDPEIRSGYQFLGFTYSSGNPILASAEQLRRELKNERARLLAAGKSVEKFDRMVLVGHSMGGLLSRLAISDSGDVLIRHVGGRETWEKLLAELPPDDREMLRDAAEFQPLPFVGRVVFIAVPHRGSELATGWLSRIGSSMVQLPKHVIHRQMVLLKALIKIGRAKPEQEPHPLNGIDNLAPDNIALQVVNEVKMSPRVPIHSLIGNKDAAGVPGGSDGIVPYSSSHLDGVVSEQVVKSGHSVQRNPLAIQALRRILLLHLKNSNEVPAESGSETEKP